MRVIIGASAPTATFTNEVGIGSSSQLIFVIDVTSHTATVTLLKNAIVLELSGTSGLSVFDSAGMEFLILLIFSTKKSPNKLHNSDADLLDGRGVVLDFPSSKWTTENSCLVFP